MLFDDCKTYDDLKKAIEENGPDAYRESLVLTWLEMAFDFGYESGEKVGFEQALMEERQAGEPEERHPWMEVVDDEEDDLEEDGYEDDFEEEDDIPDEWDGTDEELIKELSESYSGDRVKRIFLRNFGKEGDYQRFIKKKNDYWTS